MTRALCEACHLGAYRPAHRASDASRLLRKHMTAREVLVQTRSRMISLCRSLLRQEGIRVPSGGARLCQTRPNARTSGAHARRRGAAAHGARAGVHADRAIDRKVAVAVADDERVQRLTTVPSVGPVTAVTFIALVDDIARFESADKLQSYIGLVPREYSSGEKQQRGHITKAGNRRMRSLLVECAWGILRRQNPRSEALGNGLCALRRDEENASQRLPWHASSPASCSR